MTESNGAEILSLIQSTTFAEPQLVGNIAVIGLLDKAAPQEQPILSLRQALAQEKVEIHDVGQYTGLLFEPKEPVLLRACEGLLAGGRQDRIVKKSQVISGRRRTINVYCIEHQRWRRSGKEWTLSDIPLTIRRAVLEEKKQEEIWKLIEQYLEEWGVESRSEALGAIYQALGADFERFVANFEPWQHQVGMIVIINGAVSGFEYFGDNTSFCESGMRLLRDSYVPEALRGERKAMLPEDVAQAMTVFMEELKTDERHIDVVPYKEHIVYASVI